MTWQQVPQLGGFIASPIVGAIAAFVFGGTECTQISPDGPRPLDTGSEVCAYAINKGAGVTVTLIGFAICGVWLAITLWDEH